MSPATFRCGKCGGETLTEPDDDTAICPSCCEKSEDGHEFEYEREERKWACQRCGEFASDEWLADQADRV